MLTVTTNFGVAAWMMAGAALAMAAMAIRQKLHQRREARLRGDWDAY